MLRHKDRCTHTSRKLIKKVNQEIQSLKAPVPRVHTLLQTEGADKVTPADLHRIQAPRMDKLQDPLPRHAQRHGRIGHRLDQPDQPAQVAGRRLTALGPYCFQSFVYENYPHAQYNTMLVC